MRIEELVAAHNSLSAAGAAASFDFTAHEPAPGPFTLDPEDLAYPWGWFVRSPGNPNWIPLPSAADCWRGGQIVLQGKQLAILRFSTTTKTVLDYGALQGVRFNIFISPSRWTEQFCHTNASPVPPKLMNELVSMAKQPQVNHYIEEAVGNSMHQFDRFSLSALRGISAPADTYMPSFHRDTKISITDVDGGSTDAAEGVGSANASTVEKAKELHYTDYACRAAILDKVCESLPQFTHCSYDFSGREEFWCHLHEDFRLKFEAARKDFLIELRAMGDAKGAGRKDIVTLIGSMAPHMRFMGPQFERVMEMLTGKPSALDFGQTMDFQKGQFQGARKSGF